MMNCFTLTVDLFLAQFKVLLLTFKALHGLGQGFLRNFFLPCELTFWQRGVDSAVQYMLPVADGLQGLLCGGAL